MTLLHGCNGLNARRMEVLWTFRTPSLGRHVRREFMRSALLDLTPIMSATACHQRSYFETYSRFNQTTRGRWESATSDQAEPQGQCRVPRAGRAHHGGRPARVTAVAIVQQYLPEPVGPGMA